MVMAAKAPVETDKDLFFVGMAKSLHTGQYVLYPPVPAQVAATRFLYDLIAQGEHKFYVSSSDWLDYFRPAVTEIVDYGMDCFVVEARTGKVVFKASRY